MVIELEYEVLYLSFRCKEEGFRLDQFRFLLFSSTNDLGNDDRSETNSQDSLPLSKSYFKGNSDYFNASKKELIGKNLIRVFSSRKPYCKSIILILLNSNNITNFQIYIYLLSKISCFN